MRKLNISKSFMDKLTFYINPDIYKLEQEQLHGKSGENSYENVNSEFAAQSAHGRATGLAKSSPMLESAIKISHDRILARTGEAPGTLYLTGDSAVEVKPEQNELG